MKMLILKVSDHESERLTKILAAAQTSSWTSFKSLSDDAFLNENAMRDQFEESSKIIREWNYEWDLKVGITQEKRRKDAFFTANTCDNS
ncbi:hypothetical protein P6U16_16720 [Rhizobium sp. 32-5/1]|uniref:hypothetical protein n=1 Tax=Rhizobium sp. 32-5/1 TaxID=3019602 RepID=UPI00240D5F4D|nr:hypothetical protein [Rhizobium sp. 32-5/1]WEZ82667.1 hypothetical protein P6U16_16720 [Rhizobium sp. 32-5/1]